MSKYIFRNDKPYVVSVPTPYGGSLSIPPGSSVAGDYFIAFHKQSPILTPVLPGEIVHPKSIVGEFNSAKTKQRELEEKEQNTPSLEKLEIPQELSIPKDIAEPPVRNKGGRPPKKKTLEEAAKDLWKEVTFVQPDASDVDSMSKEDLSKLANKFSIPKTLSESAQRVAIKEKLRSA